MCTRIGIQSKRKADFYVNEYTYSAEAARVGACVELSCPRPNPLIEKFKWLELFNRSIIPYDAYTPASVISVHLFMCAFVYVKTSLYSVSSKVFQ